MTESESKQIHALLKKLTRDDWKQLLRTKLSKNISLNLLLDNARCASLTNNTKSRPTLDDYCTDIISLYGFRLLSDKTLGGELRELLMKRISSTKWTNLIEHSRDIYGRKVPTNIKQTANGPKKLANFWRTGSPWSKGFCRILDLPVELAQSFNASEKEVPSFDVITPATPLHQLHDFQEEVYQKLRSVLQNRNQQTMLLSLPTGSGKTRVAVEAVCDHLASTRDRRDVILWISQSRELLTQAWECFSEVWQVPPKREQIVSRRDPLQLIKVWESADLEEILARLNQNEDGSAKTVIVAGIQMLHSFVRNGKDDFFENFPLDRLCCCIVDEAHSLITKQYSEVLQELKLKKQDKKRPEWLPIKGSGLVLGLTATPWRSNDDGTKSLIRYFGNENLLYPEKKLGVTPIKKLQDFGILASAEVKPIPISNNIQFTTREKEQFDTFHEIPESYLQRLGLLQKRNQVIISELKAFNKNNKVLVFACSVDHAKILAVALNRHFGIGTAAVVSGETPKGLRTTLIERFKDPASPLRFICNVGVLTTGFDAPKTDVVCITRPTMSAALYEQMVGRGLRGEKNGGTKKCIILDVQDKELDGIQSYARVIDTWNNYKEK